MEKSKVLLIAVIALLLLNVATLSFLLMSRGTVTSPPRPDELIIERLHFDKQQQNAYRKLIREHRRQIHVVEKQRKENKEALYTLLLKDSAIQKDSLLQELAQRQQEIENIHFQHFKDIQALCREDQRTYFEALSEELAAIFRQAPPPPNR